MCLYTYVCACGMWGVRQGLWLSEARHLGCLVLHRKRKLLKWTGTVTPEASTTGLTSARWSLVLSKEMPHLQQGEVSRWRLLVGEQVQFDLSLLY